ncbi:hypothetical protein SAMN05216355_101364 [Actinomyces ruminicola]|uniref:4-amino-4-deoxy-L-arabinose transferase n=1 Tax=Actinomyces ruminicola TaxID=332524 RepID=A0A1G9ZRX1_9ACTO|nr:DUF6541 family protein [Actinomyces ruminicola]SDN23857.1 hypothetical protein SAMN05216355_101364 [Actinomyces ruminicola]
MTWLQALPAAAFLLSILLVPGYLVGRAFGLARLQSLGGAPAMSAAALGTLNVLYHWAGVPWRTVTAVIGTLVLLLLCLVGAAGARAWTRRRHGRPPASGSGWDRLCAWLRPPAVGPGPWWPLGAALALAATLSGWAVVTGIGPADQPMQASDGVWHLNAAAYVRSLADAYPIGSLAPMYWGEIHYYPTGWHALTAIVPAPIAVSANLTVLVGLAVVWPLGCASLLSALFSAPSRRVRDALPLLTGILASTVATGPFVLMATLWPYGWAVCLLPGAVSLVMVARPRHGARRATASPAGGRLAAVVACLGLVAVHGTSVFNLAVIGVPALLVVGLAAVERRWRTGNRQRAVILGLVGMVLVAVLIGVIGFWDQLRMLFTYHRPSASVVAVLREAFHDSAMIWAVRDGGWGGAGLTVVAAAGVIVSVIRRRHRWAILTAVLAVVLMIASVSTDGPLRLLASPWYLQRARIVPLLEIAVLVLAATALEGLADTARSRRAALTEPMRPRRRELAMPVAAAVLVAVSVTALGGTAVARSGFHHYVIAFSYQPLATRWPMMLSDDEADFIRSSAQLLPAGAVVLGQPTNGSAYYLSLTGTDVVYPTLRRYTEPDRRFVAAHVDEILTDPEVCVALDRLGAHYYYTDDDPTEGGAPGGAEAPRWSNRLDELPREALTPLATDGAHTLWLISACGWDE